ncbi:hypothetical protein Tco_0949042, partial [Tanacetum coccineum]
MIALTMLCRAFYLLGIMRKVEETMAEMSKAYLQAADKGKMTVFQPEIIILQDIRPTHTRKTPRIGLNLPFVIWNEMGEKFDIAAYTEMPKPMVIAVQ